MNDSEVLAEIARKSKDFMDAEEELAKAEQKFVSFRSELSELKLKLLDTITLDEYMELGKRKKYLNGFVSEVARSKRAQPETPSKSKPKITKPKITKPYELKPKNPVAMVRHADGSLTMTKEARERHEAKKCCGYAIKGHHALCLNNCKNPIELIAVIQDVEMVMCGECSAKMPQHTRFRELD